MALPDFSKFKAPYRFVSEGRAFRLYEHGEKTRTTFKTMAEAKKKVLALNNAWRASPAGRKATPNKKYDAQGHVVRKPARRAARANPRMRRNGFFDFFKSAPPLYRVTAYNRDGSTDVHTSASHAALEIALDEAGIKERAIPGLMAAAEQRPLVDSSGDVFKRMKDAYGWYRVTIELVGERPQAKSNPRRKYDESRDAAGYRALSDLKKGEFFKRKADARKVYRKGDYDRAERKFAGMDEDDISRTIYLKGSTMVYVGFDY